MMKTNLLVIVGLILLSSLFQSCKKDDCLDIDPVEITANKPAYYRDSFFVLSVPLQNGLTESDYSWLTPDGNRISGNVLRFIDNLNISDEGIYELTIGQEGCGVWTTSIDVDIQMPPLPCAPDSNVLRITSSNTFTFNSVSYDPNYYILEATSPTSTLSIRFSSSLSSKPQEGIYFLGSSGFSTYVYVTLSSGFSQWFFNEGILYVYNNNNKLTVKCCSQPFRNSSSGFESTASMWISEP